MREPSRSGGSSTVNGAISSKFMRNVSNATSPIAKQSSASFLALIFFLISFAFVYRSFYGMRIASEIQRQQAKAAAD